MTHVQRRDRREHQAVSDGGEKEEPGRVEALAECRGDDVGDACEGRPDRSLPDGLVLVCVNDASVIDLRCGLALDKVYGFRFPFSSYS
jgi:hypothetical protein